MGKAQIIISSQLLADALHMPSGTVIDWIEHDWRPGDNYLFTVINPDLPDVPEGDEIPLYVPTITKNERYTWDWGTPK